MVAESVVDEVVAHSRCKFLRQFVCIDDCFCLGDVLVKHFLALVDFGQKSTDLIDNISQIDDACIGKTIPMTWMSMMATTSGKLLGVMSPYPTVNIVVQVKYSE